jgi:hypothetical protein
MVINYRSTKTQQQQQQFWLRALWCAEFVYLKLQSTADGWTQKRCSGCRWIWAGNMQRAVVVVVNE